MYLELKTLLNNLDKSQTILLKRGAFLCEANTVDSNLYLVESGCIRIYVVEDGEEQCIRFGYKDNIITALDSFIKDEKTQFYMQALRKTKVICIPKKDFLSFVYQTPDLLKRWIEMLNNLIYQQMERERDLLCSSSHERYKNVKKRSPQLFQEVPAKYIANYLRMTPETFSRIHNS